MIDTNMSKEHSACARLFLCALCLARQRPKLFRAAALRVLTHFNHTIDIDGFFILWRNIKTRILSIMCEHSRYEVDALFPKDNAAEETTLIEQKWIDWAGPPKVLRMDMSGPHMSAEFRRWATRWSIRIDLVPKECHHALGILERNHVVRREQLSIYEKEFPDSR